MHDMAHIGHADEYYIYIYYILNKSKWIKQVNVTWL